MTTHIKRPFYQVLQISMAAWRREGWIDEASTVCSEKVELPFRAAYWLRQLVPGAVAAGVS